MGIPIVDLRQDRRHYYLRLGYSPDFYTTLAEFESALPLEARRYEPELGMWRVAKTAAAALPEFFPNFETLAARRVGPVRPLHTFIPWRLLREWAPYFGLALLALYLWRTTTPTEMTRAALDRLPAPVARTLLALPDQAARLNPTASASGRALVQISNPAENAAIGARFLRGRAVRDEFRVATPRPAATGPAVAGMAAVAGTLSTCRGEGVPLGLVYVSAQSELRDAPSEAAKVAGSGRKGDPLCVYKIEGEWRGGTTDAQPGLVWVHESAVSAQRP